MQPSTRRLSLIALLAVFVGMALLVWLPGREAATPRPLQPPRLQTATQLPELRPLAPFSLTDQQGQTYDNSRLQGHWTLLSFGYTYCPDICPTALAMLAQMQQALGEAGMSAPLEIVFVSVDPQRDTPQRLAEYLAYFDRDFVGLSGSAAAIEALTRPLGILYRKVETRDSALDYVVDHSASMMLIDPQGRYQALFSPPQDAAMMAHDILAISQAAGVRHDER